MLNLTHCNIMFFGSVKTLKNLCCTPILSFKFTCHFLGLLSNSQIISILKHTIQKTELITRISSCKHRKNKIINGHHRTIGFDSCIFVNFIFKKTLFKNNISGLFFFWGGGEGFSSRLLKSSLAKIQPGKVI